MTQLRGCEIKLGLLNCPVLFRTVSLYKITLMMIIRLTFIEYYVPD